jgi:hypothetical protein
MEHGLFRGAGIVNHHRHAGTSISAFRSSRLGQFWRAEVGNSWRAPKRISLDHFEAATERVIPY